MHKYFELLLVVTYSIVLTVASLIRLNKVPSLGSSFDDKIYHFLAYFVLMLLWYNYFRRKTISNTILISASIAIGFGLIIEILQNKITETRVFDLNDLAANTFGVIFAALIITFYRKLKLK
ncbi:hypothetical protein GCM10011531_22440 [Aquaticitalea lipolytica]|uniref:VanZ-like domain-containing protein n=1 Tax=Aquaticitalea lipolytica TaxID=1247562 RepID=A0A8J2XHP7_9FLAO|nr:VanZ family protein [Aquaticitalea lipolytica]GFZ90346.1 hypothetical protein GCM10011531_22440 [Aquaticitalea lipolytica]